MARADVAGVRLALSPSMHGSMDSVPRQWRVWWRGAGAVLAVSAAVSVTWSAFGADGRVHGWSGAIARVPPVATGAATTIAGASLAPVATLPMPIVIPPAPSTTDAPAPAGNPSGGDPQPRPSTTAVPRGHVVMAPAALGSSARAARDPSVVATAVVPQVPLYASPTATAPEVTLANPTAIGTTLVLLVASQDGPWIQAYAPVRPNGVTAWVPSADVTLSFVAAHIVVSLSARQLTLFENNAAVFHTDVAPGSPSSPTPTGPFFVTEVVGLSDPTGPYGPYALGLSAFSNTYYTFDGGPGQIAIHGTNTPWLIGSYASHGCVRLPNAAVTFLALHVAPGTPVDIVR